VTSIKEALNIASNQLRNITTDPQKEAMILLSFFLNKDQVYLFLHENDKLKYEKEYFRLIQRRVQYEPIEYITNKVSFYSEEFFIDKGALIPRPESELLVDEVLKIAKTFRKGLCIVEIGTGSGILSIILAKKLKEVKLIATDISKDAINIANKNINKFTLADKIKVIHAAYLDGVEEKIDIIISNPPYVANDFEVEKPLKYEPKEAIFGGNIGDEILRNIIKIAKKRKVRFLACEMGYNQKENISKILKEFGFKEFHFYKDWAGFDRGFVAKGENSV
jgi:release factor glutamine methyltransferase